MKVSAWRNTAGTEYGILVGEVEREAELESTAKNILIDLDGELHKFPLAGQTYGTSSTLIAGEPFREWYAKRDILKWRAGQRPVFELVEVMVPLNERRRWMLVG